MTRQFSSRFGDELRLLMPATSESGHFNLNYDVRRREPQPIPQASVAERCYFILTLRPVCQLIIFTRIHASNPSARRMAHGNFYDALSA